MLKNILARNRFSNISLPFMRLIRESIQLEYQEMLFTDREYILIRLAQKYHPNCGIGSIRISPWGKHVIVLWGLVTHELLSSSAADKGLNSRRRAESAWSGLGRLNRLSRSSRGSRLPASWHGGLFNPRAAVSTSTPQTSR